MRSFFCLLIKNIIINEMNEWMNDDDESRQNKFPIIIIKCAYFSSSSSSYMVILIGTIHSFVRSFICMISYNYTTTTKKKDVKLI